MCYELAVKNYLALLDQNVRVATETLDLGENELYPMGAALKIALAITDKPKVPGVCRCRDSRGNAKRGFKDVKDVA